jgi:hypothetical protein
MAKKQTPDSIVPPHNWNTTDLDENQPPPPRILMNKSIQPGADAAPRGKARKCRARRESLARPTQFAYPHGVNSCALSFSRKGQKLAEAMQAFAAPLLLPKLNARAGRTGGNRYDDLTIAFMDACVYLHAWLGDGDHCGVVEFPFARLYPIKGGLYNLSIRRLIDWSRVEDAPVFAVQGLFWNQAPNAKFWVKIAEHKTFEESMDILLHDPNF